MHTTHTQNTHTHTHTHTHLCSQQSAILGTRGNAPCGARQGQGGLADRLQLVVQLVHVEVAQEDLGLAHLVAEWENK